jgi:hypothetical protein
MTDVVVGGVSTAAVPALRSTRETEAILSVSHAQLYRLINARRLDARKIGSRTLITTASIEAFLAALPKFGEPEHAVVGTHAKSQRAYACAAQRQTVRITADN